MKSIFICILFLSVSMIHSQTLNLTIGTTYSSLEWTYLNPNGFSQEQYKAPLIGYAVGLGVEYMDRGLFSLSSDVSFYRSGGQLSDTEKEQRPQPGRIGFGDPDEIRVDYAALGTYVNINPINGATKLQFQIGPRIDFLISDTDQDPLKFVERRDGLSNINYGFNLGLGLHRVSEKLNYGLRAIWLSRFRQLADLDSAVTNDGLFWGAEATERVFLLQLSLGYRFK